MADTINQKPDIEHQYDLLKMSIADTLIALGLNIESEGLKRTPARIAKFYLEFLRPPDFEFTVFDNDGSDEMVIQSDIEFASLCEHHGLPFIGAAAIAYIPDGKIVGLSKLARCLDTYARRFQNQERITRQVADALQEALNPKGVAVVLKARHFCIEIRGVRKRGSITTTSCLTGVFKNDPACRNEFLSLARGMRI